MRSDELRHAARYQWRVILPALGIPPEKLTNKHQPCPVCGGRDRYRFDDRDGSGSYICTHCGNGDGFSLVMHWLDCDYRTAAAAVSDVLGIGEGKTPTPRRKPPTPPPARPRDEKMRRRYPGSLTACAIHLNPVGEELAVTEGIENALATRQLTGWPVWSALSCHGLETLALPPIKRLFIYCDGDLQGWQAGDALASRALRAGIEVALKKPDHGDALDYLGRAK